MTKQRSSIEQHSKMELQNYYNKARKLSVLIKEMEKPSNFTYVDLLDLSNIVDEFALMVKELLKIKGEINDV